LQEIILRCLEPEAARRYPSAAHLLFDLTHPDQVQVTARGQKTKGTGFGTHFKRWIKAAGMQYQPSPLPSRQIDEVPIVMVAVPYKDVTDATLYSLRQAVERSLGVRPGARLACVTVISPSATSSSDSEKSETSVHRRYLTMLRQWAQPIDLHGSQTSFHVIESSDVAQGDRALRRGQQRQRDRDGRGHPWRADAAFPGHRSRQGGHGRAVHRHSGQADPALRSACPAAGDRLTHRGRVTIAA
jgi:hypothetical protein